MEYRAAIPICQGAIVTLANRYGAAVTWRDVRDWGVAGTRLWFPDYLRESERHHGTAVGRIPKPATIRRTTGLVKAPEDPLPAILIAAPGLADTGPVKQPNRTFTGPWAMAWHAITHGRDEDDSDLVASVYGLALRQMLLQQAGDWTGTTGYTGPPLEVESIIYVDEGYDALPASRRRTLVVATVTFTVVFRQTATSLGGPSDPTVDPTQDPGPFPEVLTTELDIERTALDG
jgi:hypothetical protein